MIRIGAGELRGRVIKAPKGRTTRPTSARVREAIFDVLGHHPTHGVPLEGGHVLDLYAGSGAMGIEALSRGAARAVFVERDRKAVQTLQENLDTLGLANRARIHAQDVRRALPALRTGAPFDLVFLDPPYADEARTRALLQALAPAECLTDEGVLVLEQAAGTTPYRPAGLGTPLVKRWGDTEALFFRHEPSHD